MGPPDVEPESLSFLNVTTKSFTKNSSTKKDSAELQNGAAKDTLGFTIGPVPLQKFLDAFLPKNYTRTPKIKKNLFKDVKPASREADSVGGSEKPMYEAFVSHHTATFWVKY